MATVESFPSQTLDRSDHLQRSEMGPPNPKRIPRHTKGLSLNVPILLPSHTSQTSISPTQSSNASQSASHSPQLGSVPTNTSSASTKSLNRTSTDFLTLLAAQERKVLELKEELQKAEKDLNNLKRQWTSHENNKKREEARQIKKLQPLALEDVSSLTNTSVTDESAEEERRRRRRALVERSNNANGVGNGGVSGETPISKLGRKGSKRIFEGRHTRTLSLLSPTTNSSFNDPSPPIQSSEPESNNKEVTMDILSDQSILAEISRASPFRMTNLDGIMSKDGLQIDLGKAYKDLAAHRRSLPPTDLLVKQGKQMVDGVRDGFWTFVEDIRQATVGEEGINATEQRVSKSNTILNQNTRPRKMSKKGGAKSRSNEDDLKKDSSFWKEFGLETPQKNAEKKVTKTSHLSQKASTDSDKTPSLLGDDSEGTVGEEDHWETWDSPISTPLGAQTIKAQSTPKVMEGESLPWPKIQKPTPNKLTRTVSDLMKEWDVDNQQENNVRTVGQIG